MEYKRVFNDGINLFLGQFGTVIIGLLAMMILTRVLSTEDMGRYSLMMMFINLAVQIGLNWSDASVLRHGREEYVKDGKINKSFWARFYIFLPLLVLFSIGYIIFREKITQFIDIDTNFIYWIILLFALNGVVNYLINTFRSVDMIKKSSYMSLFQKSLFFIGLLLIYFKVLGSDLFYIFLFMALSFAITIPLYLIGFDKNKVLPHQLEQTYMQKIWSYSWPQLIGFSGLYIINYVDLFVIKKYLSIQEVGIYNVAYSGFMIITGAILLINTLFLPLIVEYKTKNKYNLIKSYFNRLPFFSVIWAVLIGIGLLISRIVIPLVFSEKYITAIPSFNVLLVATLFYFINVCLMPLVNAFDLILYSQIINIIKSIVNIVGDFVLVPKIGIIGAAYGTLISYIVGLVLTLILVYANKKTLLGESGEKNDQSHL